MHENILASAARLSDEALLSRLKVLASREREATVELVAHLAELSARKAHLGEGPGSLVEYCMRNLQLSGDAAYNRSAAARAVRRFPVILDRLADGSLNLTTVRLLAPVLTPGNHVAVLAEATQRTAREVAVIVARLAPQPDVPPSIRRIPTPTTIVGSAESSTATVPFSSPSKPAVFVQLPPAPRPVVAPLTPERYRLQFTVSKETHDRLRRIQELLRREIPDGDPGAIFDRALLLLEREVQKAKCAATTRPGPRRPIAAGSRHIPAAVRREVWQRDGGCCAFVGKSGRCQAAAFLELHHLKPFAVGGEATVENISLRCRAHNAYEGEEVFGRFDPFIVREAPANYAASGEI